MNLDPDHFNSILSGSKVYELRVFDAKRKRLKLKDDIVLYERGTQRTMVKTIIELSFFHSFREALVATNIKQILPNETTLESAIQVYESFPNYIENAKKYGVIRIKFKE
jgi:ASC-1-like (ASCH) protein